MSPEARSYGDPETRAHMLATSWELIAERGSSLKVSEVARRAGVSRQTVYLHFGDRSGLLVALVDHMDERLDLGPSLAHVRAAPTAAELLERAMRMNTQFWAAVYPVAQVLEAAQHDDEALPRSVAQPYAVSPDGLRGDDPTARRSWFPRGRMGPAGRDRTSVRRRPFRHVA